MVGGGVVSVAAVDRVVHVLGWYMLLVRPSMSVFGVAHRWLLEFRGQTAVMPEAVIAGATAAAPNMKVPEVGGYEPDHEKAASEVVLKDPLENAERLPNRAYFYVFGKYSRRMGSRIAARLPRWSTL